MLRKLLFVLICLYSFQGFSQSSIIPRPQSYIAKDGNFRLNPKTTINIPSEFKEVANLLKLGLKETANLDLAIQENSTDKNSITFKVNSELKAEGYEMLVNENGVLISASKPKGLFYGCQSLMQLLDATYRSSNKAANFGAKVPFCEIKDEPRFAYRGLMLDVGRHFMPVEFIKKYIDLMSMYKLNTFHWHLTEDQGWRIEIKQYPKLTEIGSIRKETPIGNSAQGDGTPYGGFYTQEEIKEVVAYATSKFVTVIPEIEMPGHSLGALTAYPELGCSGGPYEVRTSWGVAKDVYCPYENTFEFLENVLSEVIELFPSEYIHIGGDECPKDSWEASSFCQDLIKKEGLKDEHELQSYFISRIDSFLTSKGKKLIGWDEILEGGLSPNATVMSWRGIKGGIEAAKKGHNVIMSPNSHLYLDYYQGDPSSEPIAFGGNNTLERVYSYEPVPEELTEKEAAFVLGLQGNLWTELVKTTSHAEYMTYPRALAIAEVGWSDKEGKDFAEFSEKVQKHFGLLSKKGVYYSNSLYSIKSKILGEDIGQVGLELIKPVKDAEIRYTTDGTEPNQDSPLYTSPIVLTKGSLVKANLFTLINEKFGKDFKVDIMVNKVTGLPYKINKKPKYHTGGSEFGLTNGIAGVSGKNSTWVGLNEKTLEVDFELDSPQKLTSFATNYFHSAKSWIMVPKAVKLMVSKNGKKWKNVGSVSLTLGDDAKANKIFPVAMKLKTKKVKYIKIITEGGRLLPEWHPNAGAASWIFMDEIVIE